MRTLTHSMVVLLVLLCAAQAPAQNGRVSKAVFTRYKKPDPPRRKIMQLHDKTTVQKLNPLLYLSAGSLFVYQRVISEQIQAGCMYTVSCSAYAKKTIEEKGFIAGVFIGLHQMYNCRKNTYYDFPGHKHAQHKIVND